MAEMENTRRIAAVDVKKAKDYALAPVAKSLLLALDTLDSALRAVPPGEVGGNKALSNLMDGLNGTQKIFAKVLGEHGVARFGAVGDKFDANKYDAVSSAPAANGAEPNTVASVYQVGYTLKDRVLRPAQVVVFVK
jgi:molecular chaperone GrpE